MSARAVLITGGAARIGAALAKGLATDGWAVAIHYNQSSADAEALCAHIKSAGGRAVSVSADLTVQTDIDRLIGRAADALGTPLTALINNASTFAPDSAATFTHAGFDDHMDVNLRAPIKLAQSFAAQCDDDNPIITLRSKALGELYRRA